MRQQPLAAKMFDKTGKQMQTKLKCKGMTVFSIEHLGFKSKATATPDSKVALFTLRLVFEAKSHNATVSLDPQ